MSLYKDLNNIVDRAGFLKFSNGQKMLAIFPQRNMWGELERILQENNVKYERIQRQIDSVIRPCVTFVADDNLDFVNKVTSVIKLRTLKNKASERFDMRIENLLTNGEYVGWPTYRATDEEWKQIKELLKPFGINLYPKDGYMYINKGRTVQDYQHATGAVEEKTFNMLKQRYPNIPDENLHAIVKSDSAEEIYELLRYTLPGKEYKLYPEDWESALGYHHANHMRVYSPDVRRGVPYDGWYVRQYCGKNRQPVSYENGGEGYHISLNVKVSSEVLDALDSILQQDRGQYIDYYKFPMDSYECTRRFDPITIYTRARNPELERMIADYVASEVRDNHGLIGEMVGPGVAIAEETSKKYGRSVGEHEADIMFDKLRRMRGENR